MNFQGSNLNCNQGVPYPMNDCNQGTRPSCLPTYQQCNQVVQTCNVQDVPHYVNYHTHVINNCVKRHINIPTYSNSQENVMVNEYVQGMPLYQQPFFYNQPFQQQMPFYQQPLDQGNFGGMPNYQGTTPFTPFGA